MQSQQLSNGLESLMCIAIKIEKNEHAVVVAASRIWNSVPRGTNQVSFAITALEWCPAETH